MRILVLGATGVIGRRAVPLLVQAGHQVAAAGRTADKRATLAAAGAQPLALDVFDRSALTDAMAGIDTVINLATHIPRSSFRIMLPWSWRENDRIRREGSASVVDAALRAGVSRLIQESFGLVYPDRGDRWIDESVPLEPVAFNRTVLDAERSAGRFTGEGGAGVVLRFAGFYGPDAAHVPELVRAVRAGWAPLPGSPGAYFSSVSHDDAAAAVVASLTVPGGIYNVVDNEPLTRRDYFGTLADALGVAMPKLLPPWVGVLMGAPARLFTRSLRISNRSFRDATGWEPKYPSVREGWRAAVLDEVGPPGRRSG